MAEPASRRRVLALVAVWIAVVGAVVGAGCYPHNCDGDILNWGRNVSEGRFVSPDAWESSPIDGEWISFSHQRTIFFFTQDERKPWKITPYISAEANPNRDSNSTIGAGNIAEQLAVGAGTFAVKNDTCADYYIRVVAEMSPRPGAVLPDGGASAPSANDISTPADASPGDAEAGP